MKAKNILVFICIILLYSSVVLAFVEGTVIDDFEQHNNGDNTNDWVGGFGTTCNAINTTSFEGNLSLWPGTSFGGCRYTGNDYFSEAEDTNLSFTVHAENIESGYSVISAFGSENQTNLLIVPDGTIYINRNDDTEVILDTRYIFGEWFEFHFGNINFSNNTFTLTVSHKNGTLLEVQQGLSFTNDLQSVDTIRFSGSTNESNRHFFDYLRKNGDPWYIKFQEPETPTPTPTPIESPTVIDESPTKQPLRNIGNPQSLSASTIIFIILFFSVITYIGITYRSPPILMALMISIFVFILIVITNISFYWLWIFFMISFVLILIVILVSTQLPGT